MMGVELKANLTPEAVARFWAKVQKTESCWPWTGGKSGFGYGYANFQKTQVRAHRMAYLLTRGPIPEGLHLDHICRVRHCVNPDHLEAVTCQTNIRRGIAPTAINARKTHCKRGHAFIPENTQVRRGSRVCRACRTLASKRWAEVQRIERPRLRASREEQIA